MDWFVAELVTRLPFKSISRFKTVSKNWLYLIDSHIAFSKTRLPCRLLIARPLPGTEFNSSMKDTYTWPNIQKHAFITCDVLFEEKQLVVVDTIQEVGSSSNFCNMILKPANGLICLTESDLDFVPRIWNVSTGELSSLMLITHKNRIRYSITSYEFSSTYGFGFDPVTNTHKVVGVWGSRRLPGEDFCYVLTGVESKGYNENSTWRSKAYNENSIWRKIETPPYASHLSRVSIYVNGFIYWTTLRLSCGSWDSKFRPICLVAFDVRSEKFRTITIPDFILDLSHCLYQTLGYSNRYTSDDDRLVDLLEVGGNLAMSIKISNKMYKIFIYCDGDGSWSEVNIVLPFDLGKDQYVKFHGYGSNEKIIVILTERHVCRKEVGKERCVSFYCYDRKKDSWFEFEVNGIPSTLPHLCNQSFFTTFSPSLYAP